MLINRMMVTRVLICPSLIGALTMGIGLSVVSADVHAQGSKAETAPQKKEPLPKPSTRRPVAYDRIKAVPRKPVLKRRRFEFAPFASGSINDPYYRHFGASFEALYYLHDAFAVGLNGTWFLAHPETQNVELQRIGATAVPATFSQPDWISSLEFHWVPIYGKLSFLKKQIIPFDIYGLAGFGIAKVGDDSPIASTVGLGQRVYFNRWFAFRWELRDYAYLSQQGVEGQTRSDVQHMLLFQLGLSFFIPTEFDYRRL